MVANVENEERGLAVECLRFEAGDSGAGLTASEIAIAYKAALLDFVGGKTTRVSTDEVVRLLVGALKARKQELAEVGDLSTNRIKQYF